MKGKRLGWIGAGRVGRGLSALPKGLPMGHEGRGLIGQAAPTWARSTVRVKKDVTRTWGGLGSLSPCSSPAQPKAMWDGGEVELEFTLEALSGGQDGPRCRSSPE